MRTTVRFHAEVPAPLARERLPTPSMVLGPYYPLQPAGPIGTELWHGAARPADVRRLELVGRVDTLAGVPVTGARVELWHADPTGRYRHPSAPDGDRLDPSFRGYGAAVTDAEGRFAFSSVVPGRYVEAGTRRAPHLHLQITGRADRLVTQLFVPGSVGLREDRILAAASRPDALIPDVVHDDDDLLSLHWTAVVRIG